MCSYFGSTLYTSFVLIQGNSKKNPAMSVNAGIYW